MWEYPLVYRSGGWVPDKPREVPGDTYPDGTVSVPIDYPGWIRLFRFKNYREKGAIAKHRRLWKDWKPPEGAK